MTPVMAQTGTIVNEEAPSLSYQFASSLLLQDIPAQDSFIVQESYILPLVILPAPPKLNLDIPYSRLIYCSCVQYAKAVLGVTGTLGNAKDIIPTTASPSYGSLVITSDGGGHVGVVVSKSAETITITEANYDTCASSSREIPLKSPKIKGYKDLLQF